MKLGICYMVFDGVELLEFAIKSIRKNVDFISVTYQTTSYFGNPAEPELIPILENLKKQDLIDQLIFFEPNLKIHHKINELNLRNIGLEASKNAGCTHHISSDVDEFYLPNQLEYVKNVMDNEDFNYSVVPIVNYYKDPRFLVHPEQKLVLSLIHPVHNKYTLDNNYPKFPFHMETTRRFEKCDKFKLFTKDEFLIHHMSYVRKNIRRKFENSDNARFYNLDKFITTFDTYNVGDRVCLLPDYLNRKTILVDNIFNIEI